MKKINSRLFGNEKGAMDNILVTLLLVIIGVALVIGLKSWMETQVSDVQTAAETKIQSATSDSNGS